MPYTLALFIHVVGVVVLFVALGVEVITNFVRRRAQSVEQVVAVSSVGQINRLLHPIALVFILVGGIYMAAISSLFAQAWVYLALIVTLLMPVLGTAIHATRSARILKVATATTSRAISPELRTRIDDPILSTWNVVAPILGIWILFLMTTKPGLTSGLVAFAIALALGFALSLPLMRKTTARAQSSAPQQQSLNAE